MEVASRHQFRASSQVGSGSVDRSTHCESYSPARLGANSPQTEQGVRAGRHRDTRGQRWKSSSRLGLAPGGDPLVLDLDLQRRAEPDRVGHAPAVYPVLPVRQLQIPAGPSRGHPPVGSLNVPGAAGTAPAGPGPAGLRGSPLPSVVFRPAALASAPSHLIASCGAILVAFVLRRPGDDDLGVVGELDRPPGGCRAQVDERSCPSARPVLRRPGDPQGGSPDGVEGKDGPPLRIAPGASGGPSHTLSCPPSG